MSKLISLCFPLPPFHLLSRSFDFPVPPPSVYLFIYCDRTPPPTLLYCLTVERQTPSVGTQEFPPDVYAREPANSISSVYKYMYIRGSLAAERHA
jgi:hypothetical protein